MKTPLIILFCMCIMPLAAFHTENTGSLTVSITNIRKSGRLHIGLYRKGEKFPDDSGRVMAKFSECSGDCAVRFESVPYGEYAIAIFQDVNENNELDRGLFGIPSEPFAFSNNFRPKFGGPNFDDCRFTLTAASQEIKIEMINSLFGD